MADDANLPAPIDNAELRARAGAVQIHGGAMAPKNLAEVMEFGQLMAKAGPMVGKAFRGNPGACVAITMQAMQWGMSPFAVSQKAYVTNDSIAYEAQLVTAVINAHAPVQERPQYEYRGEAGKTRQCIITATLKGDSKPSVYTSPEVGKITTKNSPLWKTDEDQQLGYYSIRAWARKYCPEIIMGVYAVDEMEGVERTTVTSSEAIDDYDQRPADEIEEERSAFIFGEAWGLVEAHYIAQFDACADAAALEKIWKSFERKYWVGQRKCIAQLSHDGIEELYERAKIRLESGDVAFAKITAAIEETADLNALEAWRADAATETRWVKLSDAQQAETQALYEAAQERFAEEELEALRRSRAEAGVTA